MKISININPNESEAGTIGRLRDELRKTGRILKQMPLTNLDRPAGARSSWPEFKQSARIVSEATRSPLRPKPSPRDISVAETWLTLIMGLESNQRKIVLARATGIPWRRLEEMDGRSHTTLRKVEEAGLRRLLQMVAERSDTRQKKCS